VVARRPMAATLRHAAGQVATADLNGEDPHVEYSAFAWKGFKDNGISRIEYLYGER
jgi:hypothetical protein